MIKKLRPNILFIIDDQHHHDLYGFKNHPDVKTPILDNLARTGTRFENAFVQAPMCLPSRLCYYSGQYIHSHGCYGNWGPTPDNLYSLPRHLAGYGNYRTGLAGKGHIGDWTTSGFEKHYASGSIEQDDYERGYHCYLDKLGLLEKWRDFKNMENGYSAYTLDIPMEHCPENWEADRAIDLIDEFVEGSNPFFVTLSFLRPHPPLSPPFDCPFKYDYRDIKLPSTAYTEVDPSIEELFDQRAGLEKKWQLKHTGEENYRKGLANHYSLISLIDYNIGRVLDHLKKLGTFDDTLIIFSSDHGDFAGHYGQIGKQVPHFDALHRVASIWHWKDQISEGASNQSIFESVDFFPTVCDLIDLEIPPTIQGTSMAKCLKENIEIDKPAFFEFVPYIKTIRNKNFKLTLNLDTDFMLMSDLKKDPYETRNVADLPEYDQVKRELLLSLLRWYAKTEKPKSVFAEKELFRSEYTPYMKWLSKYFLGRWDNKKKKPKELVNNSFEFGD